jgi:tRNA A37 threonylcarbamoyladenosine dehydratase
MELLAGTEGMARLTGASVAVFGIGGVGSYAAEALARAGVGRLTLIDFDDICLTNVNRLSAPPRFRPAAATAGSVSTGIASI